MPLADLVLSLGLMEPGAMRAAMDEQRRTGGRLLRHQFTSYDASYLALAEALQVPLWTCDAKLATNGHDAEIHLMPQTH